MMNWDKAILEFHDMLFTDYQKGLDLNDNLRGVVQCTSCGVELKEGAKELRFGGTDERCCESCKEDDKLV